MSPFDFINAINMKTGHLEATSEYTPFIINKAFSNNIDTVFWANEANKYHMTPQMSFDFYYYGIDKRKRYGKWFKKDNTNEEHIELVKEYYGYSTQKALDVYPLLREKMDEIKASLDKGGVVKQRNKK